MSRLLTYGILQQKRKATLLLDTYTGAAAAFSVRKLNSAYTGNCMQIFVQATLSTHEIGFVNGVIDESAILSAAGSNIALVNIWYDQSGNGNNASATGIRRPEIATGGAVHKVNGKCALKFNTHHLTLTNTVSASGDFSAFTVYKRDATNTTCSFFGNLTKQYPYSAWEYLNGLSVYVCNRNGQSYASCTVANHVLYSSFSISNVLSLYGNGASKSLTAAGGGGTADFDSVGVVNTAYANGYLQEGIIYTSDKSADRSSIESDINTYYSIY